MLQKTTIFEVKPVLSTMKGITILLVLFELFIMVHSYKFLALYGFASKSHLNAFIPVLNELAERGHEITLFQPYPDVKVHSAIKKLHSFDIAPMKEQHSKMIFEEIDNPPSDIAIVQGFTQLAVETTKMCLASTSMKALIKQGKQFDVVLVGFILNEYGLVLSPLLGNFTVYHAAGSIPNFYSSPAPVSYASVPNAFMSLPPVMNFWQRLTNTIASFVSEVGYSYHLLPAVEKVVKELVPEASTSHLSLNKISLYLTNVDPVVSVPKPTVPNMVSLCCPHCRDVKPLPKDLESFLSTTGDEGFIMFGLGSHAQSRHFPLKTKNAFLDAFSKLKQKVIWKFEDDNIEPPSNVFVMKWMPQQDLLGHPKLRLFITHGGLLSLQEAIYHAVPIIGVPLFADQPGNVEYLVDKGVAGKLQLKNITSECIYQEISKLLDNHHRYSERMKVQSAILRDHSKNTVEHGANWLEYVARHDGAWHLRTENQDMCFFQYFLIDIFVFVLMASFIVLFSIRLLFKLVIKRKL